MSINPIDGSSIHKITSGQVVIDLQTAVKELVENSLDAGATNIEVRFKQHGLQSIQVIDNGSGIPEAYHDSIALKHHTSKLASYADLTTVRTFGFRGEALSSLCALSNSLNVTTATDPPMGQSLDMDTSGVVHKRSRTARQRGTTVSLTNLFQPLPVRRKEFERNSKREFSKALALLNAYALGPCCTSPTGGVRLTVSNQQDKGAKTVLLRTLGSSSSRAAVSALWGPKSTDNLADLDLVLRVEKEKTALKRLQSRADDAQDLPVTVKGLISNFSFGSGRTGTDRQFLYVNGRPCNLPKIQKAFNEVYRSFNTNQSPFILADFIIPTDACDINVSPDKRTIFLHSESNLISQLKAALEQTFAPSRSTYEVHPRPSQRDDQPLLTQSTLHGTKAMTDLGKRKRGQSSSLPPEEEEDGAEEDDNSTPSRLEPQKRNRRRIHDEPLSPSDVKPSDKKQSTNDDEMDEGRHPNHAHVGKTLSSTNLASYAQPQPPQPQPQPQRPHQPPPLLTEPASSSTPRPTAPRISSSLPGSGLPSSSPLSLSLTPSKPNSDPPPLPRVITSDVARMEDDDDDDGPEDSEIEVEIFRPTVGAGARNRGVGEEVDKDDDEKDDKDVVVVADTTMTTWSQATRSCSPVQEEEEEEEDEDEDKSEEPTNSSRRHQDAHANAHADDQTKKPTLSSNPTETQTDTHHRTHSSSSPLFLPSSPIPIYLTSHTEPDDDDDEPSLSTSGLQHINDDDDTNNSSTEVSHPEVVRTTSQGDVTLRFKLASVAEVWSSSRKIPVSVPSESTTEPSPIPTAAAAAAVAKANISNTVDDAKAVAALARIIEKEDFASMEIIGQFNLGFIVARRRRRRTRRRQRQPEMPLAELGAGAVPPPLHEEDKGEGEGEGEKQVETSLVEMEMEMDDLFIVDQHAADEKYNFETLQQTTSIRSQKLFRPQALELTASDELLAMENLDVLRQNGFEVRVAPPENNNIITDDDEDMEEGTTSGTRLELIAQPVSKSTVFDMKDLEELIHLLNDRPTGQMVRCSKARAMFAMRACRKSVMIGMPLNRQQMSKVVKHMRTMDQPWNCPHGRPTMRHLLDLSSNSLGLGLRREDRKIDWLKF